MRENQAINNRTRCRWNELEFVTTRESCHRNEHVVKYGLMCIILRIETVRMAAEGAEAEIQQKEETKRHTYPLVRVRIQTDEEIRVD